jgi:hypothetical protein
MKHYQIYYKGVEVSRIRGGLVEVMQALLDADRGLTATELREVTGIKYPSGQANQLRTLHNIRIKSEGKGQSVKYWLPEGYKMEEI